MNSTAKSPPIPPPQRTMPGLSQPESTGAFLKAALTAAGLRNLYLSAAPLVVRSRYWLLKNSNELFPLIRGSTRICFRLTLYLSIDVQRSYHTLALLRLNLEPTP